MNQTREQEVTPAWASVTRAAHRIEAQLEEALSRVGLSLSKYQVLNVLVLAGEPLPLSDLAQRFGCVKSNVTQLVDRLEADGLVERQDDVDDRRSVRAALTSLGHQRAQAGSAALEETDTRLFSRLKKHEVMMLIDLLSRLDDGE